MHLQLFHIIRSRASGALKLSVRNIENFRRCLIKNLADYLNDKKASTCGSWWFYRNEQAVFQLNKGDFKLLIFVISMNEDKLWFVVSSICLVSPIPLVPTSPALFSWTSGNKQPKQLAGFRKFQYVFALARASQRPPYDGHCFQVTKEK